MCGIAGLFTPKLDRNTLLEKARAMGNALLHRGPDSEGAWAAPDIPLAFSHRRLSIIDLSPAGAQPMESHDGRYVLSYNGEIFNHLQLREELDQSGYSPPWRGHSDTEVLLACIQAWGIPKTLNLAEGQFAFALWDKQARNLTLARDRAGEKPLMFGWNDATFMFASELRALHAIATKPFTLDRQSLAAMLEVGCIPGHRTPYQEVQKVPPGTYVTFNESDLACRTTFDQRKYWNLPAVTTPLSTDMTDQEMIDELDARIVESVRRQLVADVPVGVFLSGGIDSSTILAIAQGLQSRPIRSFTIGLTDRGYDESKSAKLIATHVGSQHEEWILNPNDAISVIPGLGEIFDEPFGDASQIPTLLISKLARKQVTVALSGDGGDELFMGYNRHILASKLGHLSKSVPFWMRNAVANAVERITPSTAVPIGHAAGIPAPDEKTWKLANVLRSDSIESVYTSLTRAWPFGQAPIVGQSAESFPRARQKAYRSPADLFARNDFNGYLPDDILVKVDRASMHCSLETRAPLLSHHIIEYAFMLPERMKLRAGVGKWALRRVNAKYLPSTLQSQVKQGFSVPLADWLRGGLQEWVQDSLSHSSRSLSQDIIDWNTVNSIWKRHESGAANYTYHLWHVLMLQAWLSRNARFWSN